MTLSRRRLLLIAAALPLAGSPRPPERLEWRGDAFGGEARILLEGQRDAAEAALAEVAAEIDRLEAIFSLHRPDSQLSRLNRDGRLDRPARVLRDTLARALDWTGRTEGAFDARVQPLWRAAARDLPAPTHALSARIDLGADQVRLTPGGALTLNGIAQGAIADRIAELLRRRGFAAPLVDTGEMRLPGPVRRTLLLPDGVPLALAGCAAATSVPGALRFASGAGHIIDPQRPVAGSGPRFEPWRSVTVIAPDATDADALSTAFALCPAERIGDLAPPDSLVIAIDQSGRQHRFGAAPKGSIA